MFFCGEKYTSALQMFCGGLAQCIMVRNTECEQEKPTGHIWNALCLCLIKVTKSNLSHWESISRPQMSCSIIELHCLLENISKLALNQQRGQSWAGRGVNNAEWTTVWENQLTYRLVSQEKGYKQIWHTHNFYNQLCLASAYSPLWSSWPQGSLQPL